MQRIYRSMQPPALLALLLVAAMGVQVDAEENSVPCTVAGSTTGSYYDLRPLRRSSGEDWLVKGTEPEGNKTLIFHLNVCDQIRFNGTGMSSPWKIGAFQSTGDKQGFSIGRFNKKPIVRDSHLLLEYGEGDECGASVGRRKTVISFICDKTVEGPGQPQLLTAVDSCVYVFDWRTQHACATETPPVKDDKDEAEDEGGSSGGESGGSTVGAGGAAAGASAAGAGGSFLGIVLTLASSYAFVGILYKRFVLNARGMEQLPNVDFWREAVDWCKDMAQIMWYKVNPHRPPRRYMTLDEDHGLPFDDHDDEDDDDEYSSQGGGFGLHRGGSNNSGRGDSGGLSISDRSGKGSTRRYNNDFADEVDAADDAIRVLLHDEQDAEEVTKEEVVENVMEQVVVEEFVVEEDPNDPDGYYRHTRPGGNTTTSDTVQGEDGQTVTTQVTTTTRTVVVDENGEEQSEATDNTRLIDDL